MHQMSYHGVPWLSKWKNSICACSKVSRVSIYVSNESPCGTMTVTKNSQFGHAE